MCFFCKKLRNCRVCNTKSFVPKCRRVTPRTKRYLENDLSIYENHDRGCCPPPVCCNESPRCSDETEERLRKDLCEESCLKPDFTRFGDTCEIPKKRYDG